MKGLFSKNNMGDRAYKKINIETKNKKSCAFSEDEEKLIVVTKDAHYHLFKVETEQQLTPAPHGNSLFPTK
jgi:hypothetical protein